MLKKILYFITHPNKALLYMLNFKIFRNLKDETFLKIEYKLYFGQKLNLDNPVTFNEKLQWLKIHDRNPEYTKLVDKIAVKDYIKKVLGEEYIIPTLGTYDTFDEIDFSKLPNQFVLKCNHDSGGLLVCKDKSKLDIKEERSKINKCLNRNYYYLHREWPYKNVKPKILIEKYMSDEQQPELIDYKFFCFNGEPKFLYISQGLWHESRISFLDMNYNPVNFKRTDYKEFEVLPKCPKHFEEMKKLAKILSKNIPFVRADFYEINNQVYFSELTFTPCSGMLPFKPKEYDKIIGEYLKLPNQNEDEGR